LAHACQNISDEEMPELHLPERRNKDVPECGSYLNQISFEGEAERI
jgi:hypothetical protein